MASKKSKAKSRVTKAASSKSRTTPAKKSASRSKTKAAPKKVVTPVRRPKGTFSARDVLPRKRVSINDALDYLEQHRDELEKRKGENEDWAISVDGFSRTVLYATFESMLQALRKYDTTKKFGDKADENTDWFLSHLKFVRVKESDTRKHLKSVREHKAKHEEHKAEVKERAIDMLQTTKTRKRKAEEMAFPHASKRVRKSNTDILEALLEQMKEQQKLIAELKGEKKRGKQSKRSKSGGSSARTTGAKSARSQKRTANAKPKKSTRKQASKKAAPSKRVQKTVTAKRDKGSSKRSTARKSATKSSASSNKRNTKRQSSSVKKSVKTATKKQTRKKGGHKR